MFLSCSHSLAMRFNGRPATRERVTALALLVLEEALAAAADGPVARTRAHRLALCWLTLAGVATEEDCYTFWSQMAEEHSWAPSPVYANGQRTHWLRLYLDRWHRSAGWSAPDETARRNLEPQRSNR